MEGVLWQVLAGTRGGPNRARILRAIRGRPRNRNQLAADLDLNYKTVEHHLEVLVDTGLVASTDSDYGAVYYLTEQAESHWDAIEDIMEQMSQ